MDILDYNSFAEACIEELKILQEKFQNDYEIDSYDNWYYNQSTGLLTFSTRDQELNFKYFSIGSFSAKSNTWKWSWDNETTLEKVKVQVNSVREFGQQSKFEKLTTGCFESDEFEAWEFLAIAAKLTSGIGVYRPVNDEQLKLFFVITEVVENDIAKGIKDKYVECGLHGFGRIAFVCKHINSRTKVGFEEAFETFEDMELSDDDDFQAWCDKCEAVRQSVGEWNDRTMEFADIKVVCEKCYFEMKELNLGYK